MAHRSFSYAGTVWIAQALVPLVILIGCGDDSPERSDSGLEDGGIYLDGGAGQGGSGGSNAGTGGVGAGGMGSGATGGSAGMGAGGASAGSGGSDTADAATEMDASLDPDAGLDSGAIDASDDGAVDEEDAGGQDAGPSDAGEPDASADAGVCSNPVACDDGDSCTTDSCDETLGCQHTVTCERGTCDNFIDDDGDGTTDCDDPTCVAEPTCYELGALCDDGIDNDSDGFSHYDCNVGGGDLDCRFEEPCRERCGDFIDNDIDGLTDECGGDCARTSACGFEIDGQCENGIDDDSNGSTDCADPTCATASACGDGCPAQVLTSGTTSGTNASAPAVRTGPCATASTGREVTFLFTAGAAGIYTFDTRGSSYDTVLYVRDACNGVDLTCNDDFGASAQSSTALALGAGDSVVVVLDAANAEAIGTYVLNVTRPGAVSSTSIDAAFR